jgi:hypothetical protein
MQNPIIMNKMSTQEISKLSYKEYLTYIKEQIPTLVLLDDAQRFMTDLVSGYIKENDLTLENYFEPPEGKRLYMDEDILRMHQGPKTKEDIEQLIKEFRLSLSQTLGNMINARSGKPTPKSPIKN